MFSLARRFLVPLLFVFPWINFAQINVAQPGFRADSKLVLVPVSVTDHRGTTVNGLHKSGFQISEDRVAQGIYSFSEEDVPASMGIVLDISGSMRNSLPAAKAALETLTANANPGDEAFLYTVSDRPSQAMEMTSDLEALASRSVLTRAGGSTALVDSVFDALRAIRPAGKPRRGLIVISDGMDNHSRHTQHELLEQALEADVQIYTVCLYSPPASVKAMPVQQAHEGLVFLDELAKRTGGVPFVAHDLNELNRSAEAIQHLLHNEYVIGYVPSRGAQDANGRWHKIEVRLNIPGLTVHARPGYYSE